MSNELTKGTQELAAPQPKRGLARIEDLYGDVELAAKTNDYLKLVNAEPNPKWVKEHPMAFKEVKDNTGNLIKVPILHIPVGIVEYLLTALYQQWRIEIKSVQILANSAVVTIRLWYFHPISQTWEWQDGVGGAPLRTNKGASATDFSQIQNSAVQTGVPAAKSYALKDAAENIGKIFGKDLNRDSVMDYQPTFEKMFQGNQLPDELKAVIAECTDKEQLAELYAKNTEYHHIAEFMNLITARKTEISTHGNAAN